MATNRLNARNFESVLTDHGMPVLWERAERCTCLNPQSLQPNYTCVACHGEGYIYDAPVESSAIVIANLALNKEFTQMGDYRAGDCVATIPANYKVGAEFLPNPLFNIGERDQITLLYTEFRSSEVLWKGSSYPNRAADTLRNPNVTRVLGISQADPVTGVIRRFSPEIDYTLEGNVIHWIGEVLADGEPYSVLYYHLPNYIVYSELPQARDQDGQHLPKRIVLRYRDAFYA